MEDKLMQFASAYDHTVKVNGTRIMYKVAVTKEDFFERVLPFASDSRFSMTHDERYSGLVGIQAGERKKPLALQKLSLTSFYGVDLNTGNTVVAATNFYYPPETQKSLKLFRRDEGYLVPISYFDMNKEGRDVFFLGFVSTNGEYRARFSLGNFKAYMKWLKAFVEVYQPDSDFLGISQGKYQLNEFEDSTEPIRISELEQEMQDNIGKPRPESEASNKFSKLIGMKEVEGVVSRTSLGSLFHGELSDVVSRIKRRG